MNILYIQNKKDGQLYKNIINYLNINYLCYNGNLFPFINNNGIIILLINNNDIFLYIADKNMIETNIQ